MKKRPPLPDQLSPAGRPVASGARSTPQSPRCAPLPLSRRQFLRLGASGVLLVVGGPLLPACGGEPSGPPNGEGPGPPDPEQRHPRAVGVLLSDPRLCGGCGRCAITCSALHGDGPGAAFALVGPEPIYQQVQFEHAGWFAATCRMCPETHDEGGTLLTPDCVAVCPTGAATIAGPEHPSYGGTRVRYIDAGLCIGCARCVEACPHQHPLLQDGLATKCDLCVGTYVYPPCAEACPSSALTYVTPWAETLPARLPWLPADDEPAREQ